MGRFDNFTKKEKAVIRTSLEWTEPEFYDPRHTEKDRDVPMKRRPPAETQEGKDERLPEYRRRNREMQPREYNGFLYVECDSCGDRHAFCAKKPISVYRCNECGGRTPLTYMSYLRVACECGAKFSYNTNVDTGMMDVNCFKCGSPVPVEWSERRQRYQPIGYHNTGGRRKKK